MARMLIALDVPLDARDRMGWRAPMGAILPNAPNCFLLAGQTPRQEARMVPQLCYQSTMTAMWAWIDARGIR